MIPLTLTGITYSQASSGAYALILSEQPNTDSVEDEVKHPNRKLPIIIGSWEAQSIAEAFQNDIMPKRPLTHDLFATFAHSFGIKIEKVVIYKLLDGIFYSTIYAVRENDGIGVELDSRTSDAVALALRFHAPIFTYPFILDVAGVLFRTKEDIRKTYDCKNEEESEKDESVVTNEENVFAGMDIDGLYTALEVAVKTEDYEQAASIRDEINNRKLM